MSTWKGAFSRIRAAVTLVGILSLLCGIAYPLAITIVATIWAPESAQGSLLVRDGVVVGSSLIGQSFESPAYFFGRPSATPSFPYDASLSGGSNLGPTNPELVAAVRARIALLRAVDPGNHAPIPVDLVTSSGSGLDPHISLAAAEYQLPRVARARGVDEERVRELVLRQARGRSLGVLGEPHVNVLLLNLALDEAFRRP